MTELCVLTGDIVDSSDLFSEDVDEILRKIEAAARDMDSWLPSESSAQFARRGGDGWQMALAPSTFCLRAAVYIQACLRRDGDTVTRIAIAVGDGTFPSTGDLNSAHGPVFTASGRLLSDITGHALLAHASGGAHHAATRLADHMASGWTQAQARAVAALLPPTAPTRAEVASTFGITRQAVNQALWSAGFPALDDALRAIEAEDSK